MTDIPELPTGYFFEVTKGVSYLHYPENNVDPMVLIKKRVWLLWSTTEFSIRLTNITGTHPTPEHVRRGMVQAKEDWEKNLAKSKVYGQYPPNKLKDILNGTTS